MLFQNLRTATSDRDIPELPGVYAFFVDILGPYTFGLRRGERVTPANWPKISEAIGHRFKNLRKLFREASYEGQIDETGKFGNVRSGLNIAAYAFIPEFLPEDIEKLSPTEANAYLSVAKKAQFFLPPIYVGVTYEQTLRDRYRQHELNFSSKISKNIFGSRFKDSGFVWDDLIFAYADLRADELVAAPLKFLESQIHLINPPVLSSK